VGESALNECCFSENQSRFEHFCPKQPSKPALVGGNKANMRAAQTFIIPDEGLKRA